MVCVLGGHIESSVGCVWFCGCVCARYVVQVVVVVVVVGGCSSERRERERVAGCQRRCVAESAQP